MAFMEVKPTTFLVREEGFDAKAFFVPIAGSIGQIEIGDQKDGFGIALFPPGNHRHRAIAFFSEPNVGHADQIIRLNEQVAEGKEVIVFIHQRVFGGAADILQPDRL